MCPECLASAGWIVGSALSSGGVTALLVGWVRSRTEFFSFRAGKEKQIWRQR